MDNAIGSNHLYYVTIAYGHAHSDDILNIFSLLTCINVVWKMMLNSKMHSMNIWLQI